MQVIISPADLEGSVGSRAKMLQELYRSLHSLATKHHLTILVKNQQVSSTQQRASL